MNKINSGSQNLAIVKIRIRQNKKSLTTFKTKFKKMTTALELNDNCKNHLVRVDGLFPGIEWLMKKQKTPMTFWSSKPKLFYYFCFENLFLCQDGCCEHQSSGHGPTRWRIPSPRVHPFETKVRNVTLFLIFLSLFYVFTATLPLAVLLCKHFRIVVLKYYC